MNRIIVPFMILFLCLLLVACTVVPPAAPAENNSDITIEPETEPTPATETTHTKHTYSTPKNCSEVEICTVCGQEGEKRGAHDFQGGDCQTPEICTICGTEGELREHVYEDATCTDPAVCSVCGTEIAPAIGHNIVVADCTSAAHCKLCDYTEGEPLGHEGVGICKRCGELGNMAGFGSGDCVLTDVMIPNGGLFTITFSGDNITNATTYDKNDKIDYLLSNYGSYYGTILLKGDSPLTIEVSAKGTWSWELQEVSSTTQTSFSGSSDYVTPMISCSSGTWEINYDGDGVFFVSGLTANGTIFVVSNYGKYNGQKYIKVPTGSYILFEITADAPWSLKKID